MHRGDWGDVVLTGALVAAAILILLLNGGP